MKNVIITGATKGLGLACTQSYLSKGFKVFCSGRDKKFINKLINKYPKQIIFIDSDISSPEGIKSFTDKIKSKIKKIDIIIHCLGGGLGLKDPLIEYYDFQKLFNINIGIAAELNRVLVKLMKKESYIVLIGSTASIEAVGSVGYNTIKYSIVSYVKSLALNLISKKIYVSALLPGAFEGNGNAFNRLKLKNLEAYKDFINSKLITKKIAKANDFIPFINLLTSKHGQMLTGSSISMDNLETKSYHYE
jgi:NAD(P)-dependent dehydrogenase (short-subunit alcohol dehydrogenase family)|tara:strand:+ start:795 stop:1538 length:744 start_codon:yes stop_codon:yes gene_type:complete